MRALRYVALAGAALPLMAQEVKVEAEKQDPKALQWNAGGDFRVRQEIYDNLPGEGGRISRYNSYFRMRGRLWGEVKNEDFKLYLRFADEFREYVRKPTPRHEYGKTPGELIVDNLYLDLYNTFWDRVDWRIGRQDFLGRDGANYGAGRTILEGNAMDGSRAFFFDAVKATIKFDDEKKNTLDILGIYNSAKTFSLGSASPVDRGDGLPLNCIEPWSRGLVEWGGALYFKSKEWKEVPFELYYIYMDKSSYRLMNGTKMQGRTVNTWGLRVVPQITDTLSAEFEVAAQYGTKDSGATVGGQMGYAGLTYKMPTENTFKPYATLAVLYMSGDRNRGTGRVGDRENDRSWDPLWARYTLFENEMYPYRNVYGVAYWSNVIYPNLKLGTSFEVKNNPFKGKHEVFVQGGPMFVAVRDVNATTGAPLCGGDGYLYGTFLRARYDFPLWTGFFMMNGKNQGRFLGHVTGEILEPGDYCASSKMAYFVRWEVSVAF